MNNKKISWELGKEDLEKFKPLYDEMSKEIARDVDKEIIEKLLGPNWEITMEFNMVAQREKTK